MSLSNGSYTRTEGSGQTIDPCRPLFYEESVPAGEIAGRKTFKMVERVRIVMPGNGLNMPVFNVSDEHRERWPQAYEAFKKGLEPALNGTPLEEWAILNKAQVMELKAAHILTIEDVAALPDTAVQRIGRGGYALRDRAKAYLDEAEEQALVTRVTAENEVLREQQAVQSRQIAEMGAMLESLQKQMQAAGDAPNPITTIVPASMDVNERSKPIYAEQEQGSAFDNLAPAKRRGRPPKSKVAR